MDNALSLVVTAIVAAAASFGVFLACFSWLRREQRRMQRNFLAEMAKSGRESDELILTGRDAVGYGELVAQFKVNHGRQIVSVLESDGKRFIHIDGELTTHERTKMVHYLKSEGFLS